MLFIGKPSINVPFSMAMLVITRGYPQILSPPPPNPSSSARRSKRAAARRTSADPHAASAAGDAWRPSGEEARFFRRKWRFYQEFGIFTSKKLKTPVFFDGENDDTNIIHDGCV